MHLLHVFPSFQIGGSQRRFAALANHFGERYQHTIVSLDGNWEAARLITAQVPHTKFSCLPKIGFLASVNRARLTIRAQAPDLLITYNWGAIEWAAANLDCKARHVHIEDGFGREEAHGQLQRRVLFRRVVLNCASTLVLPSRTLVNIAIKAWHISAARVIYVPNGIACARFNLQADQARTRSSMRRRAK